MRAKLFALGLQEMQWFLSSRDLYITELVVGCACAATLLVAFLYFFKRVASVARHKSQWCAHFLSLFLPFMD